MTGAATGVGRYKTRRSARNSGDDSAFENDSSSCSGGTTGCEEDLTQSQLEHENVGTETPAEVEKHSHKTNHDDGDTERESMNMTKMEVDEGVEEKDAKIKKLELHLEVILDENNLLQLELEDVQKTSEARIAELETELSGVNQKMADLSSVMEQTKGTLLHVKGLNAAGEKMDVKAVSAKLNELYSLFNLPDTSESRINQNDSSPPAVNQNKATGGLNGDKLESAAALETSNVILASKASSRGSVRKTQSTPPSPLPVRRSQRTSAKAFKVQINKKKEKSGTPKKIVKPRKNESEDVPPVPSLNPHLSSPSPPKLEPAVEIKTPAGIVAHERDYSKGDGFHCICGRNYLTKQKLGLHIRQYTCEWKFSCGKCTVKFFEAYRLRAHMRESHGEEVVGSHGCYYCGKIFEERRDLFTHQNEEHKCGPFSNPGHNHLIRRDKNAGKGKRRIILNAKKKTSSSQKSKLKNQKRKKIISVKHLVSAAKRRKVSKKSE